MRRILAALLALSLLAGLAFAQDPAPQYGGEIVVAITADPPGWDPTASTSQEIPRVVYNNVFEGLVRFDSSGAIVPALAESWSISDDGLVWTFQIREGVLFHDGSALTLDDIAAKFARAQDPDSGHTHPEYYSAIADIATDEMANTVTFTLSGTNSSLLYNLARPDSIIYPAAAAETQRSQPIGTGPFRFVSYLEGAEVRLERFDDYYLEGVPYLDAATFRIISDPNTRFAALQAGDIDLMGVTPEQFIQLDSSASLKGGEGTATTEITLAMNNYVVFFSVSGEFEDLSGPATAAHIHVGAAGENGPVAIPLTLLFDDDEVRTSGTYSYTGGLSPAEYDRFLEGALYINLHTETNPGGELRTQLQGSEASPGELTATLTSDAVSAEIESEASGDAAASWSINPLGDQRVRAAITHAIDKNAIVNGAMFGLGTVIGTHMSPAESYYIDLSDTYPYDPERARQLLADAGYADGFTIRFELPEPYPIERRSGQVIAQQLAEVGIDVDLSVVEWGTWIERIFLGGDYDMTIIGHSEPRDINIYANPDYYYKYDNPEIGALLAEAEAAVTEDAQVAAYQQIARIIAEDAVNVWVFSPPSLWAAQSDVYGFWTSQPTPAIDITGVYRAP